MKEEQLLLPDVIPPPTLRELVDKLNADPEILRGISREAFQDAQLDLEAYRQMRTNIPPEVYARRIY
jgi:hypothetical protein